MYEVLSKDIIELEIVSYLLIRKRRFKSKVPVCEIVNCILYKLITGVQWLSLAILKLVSSNHNDLYNIEVHFGEVKATLEYANISLGELFLNVDAF